ncbi:MAG: hypothetical protein JO079_11145 [Frankiaceae bacterium]|nr:hypothetical protein [Frankiaceae bacterium]
MNLDEAPVERIAAFTTEHDIPVYYLLYNPLDIPLSVDVPATVEDDVAQVENVVGARVVSAPSILREAR